MQTLADINSNHGSHYITMKTGNYYSYVSCVYTELIISKFKIQTLKIRNCIMLLLMLSWSSRLCK